MSQREATDWPSLSRQGLILLGPLARQRGLEAAEQAGQGIGVEDGAVVAARHRFSRQQAVGHGVDLADEGLAVQCIEAAFILPLGEHGLTTVALDEGGAVAADAERLMLTEAALAVGEPQPPLSLEEAVVGAPVTSGSASMSDSRRRARAIFSSTGWCRAD